MDLTIAQLPLLIDRSKDLAQLVKRFAIQPCPNESWVESGFIRRHCVVVLGNGLTFIEAYKQVLETAKLHPSTTIHHLHSVAPETDPEALLHYSI
ncbi:MAG: hypothetical protein K6T90_14520 [Leptolyngbyaceae cyanobacterium HOT.MB2.61]|nr:hypothetical protein [Leptolyngbyaceae cyanobacterium HOT.MB2.61]